MCVNPEGKEKLCCGFYPDFSVGSKAGMEFVSHDPCISHDLQEKHGKQPAGEYLLKGLCIAGARTGRRAREAPQGAPVMILQIFEWKCLLLTCI